jgi:hypothetical protein
MVARASEVVVAKAAVEVVVARVVAVVVKETVVVGLARTIIHQDAIDRMLHQRSSTSLITWKVFTHRDTRL